MMKPEELEADFSMYFLNLSKEEQINMLEILGGMADFVVVVNE